MKRFLTLALTCLPLLCFGATTYTTYFNNTHTYTNATVVGTNFAGRGVFTNGITAGASTFTGEITSTLGTITADASALDATATWNNSGVTFTGLKLNITATAAAAGSKLLDLQNSGASSHYFESGAGAMFGNSAVAIGRAAPYGLMVWNGGQIGFGSGAGVSPTSTMDVILVRDGAANTLAMRNGTAAQNFFVYNTFTDASNYERASFGWGGNIFFVGVANAGTGSARDLKLSVPSTSSIYARIGGTDRWQFNASGHLLAVADNSYDIGASGATRPRTGYFGTSIAVAADGVFSANALTVRNGAVIEWSGRSSLRSAVNGNIQLANSAGSDFDRLQFGGTTASFPALKRSSTELQVRLADDSADAPLKSGQLSNTGIRVMTPSSLQTLAAANALLANATKVRVVGSGGAVTLTSTPTIADGSDGQYVMIQGTDDTNALTVQDQGSLASSNLELGAATRVLGAGDVLVLTFDTTASVWYEVSFANN